MIQQLDIDALDGLELEPVAVVRQKIAWFEDRGFVFFPEIDDLDSYRIAAIQITDGLVVALRRYDHAPYSFPDLLMPGRFLADPRLHDILAGIGHAFGNAVLEVGPALTPCRSASENPAVPPYARMEAEHLPRP